MVKPACRNPEKGNGVNGSDHEHRAGKYRGAVKDVRSAGRDNGLTRDVVRIDGHTAGNQQQIGPLGKEPPDFRCNPFRIIRGEGDPHHLGAHFIHFSAQDRFKLILDQVRKDLASGDQDAHLRPSQRFYLEKSAAGAGDRNGLLDNFRPDHQRNGAKRRNGLSLLHRKIVMAGGAHHFGQEVDLGQCLRVYLKQPVMRCDQIDLALRGFTLPGDAVAAERIGHRNGGIVFVEAPFLDLQDIKVAFPQPLQMTDIGLRDLVPFSECRTFELASADFSDIMGKDRSCRVFDVDDPLAHFSL